MDSDILNIKQYWTNMTSEWDNETKEKALREYG